MVELILTQILSPLVDDFLSSSFVSVYKEEYYVGWSRYVGLYRFRIFSVGYPNVLSKSDGIEIRFVSVRSLFKVDQFKKICTDVSNPSGRYCCEQLQCNKWGTTQRPTEHAPLGKLTVRHAQYNTAPIIRTVDNTDSSQAEKFT